MRRIATVWMLMLLVGTATAQEQSLFNGTDLTGWGGAPGWWIVEDGAITSESTPEKPCRRATYLVWEGGEPADFELSLDFKLSPNSPKANSGVQIRSERRPDWDTFGYQADMDAAGKLVGFVYHHGRGLIAARGEKVNITAEGKREAETVADSEQLKAVFKPGEWNHYRIVCLGPDITLYVNDVLMCEFSDHDPKQARSDGIIALQMHPGPPMKVQFKNIVLKPLAASPDAAVDAEAAHIAVLASDAGVQEKVDACRELARIGTSAAVPALAAMLTDEKLSHMARYGLETIPGTDVDEALLGALGQLKGDPLAGLVSSIGLRRDAKAVDALAALLTNEDTAVSQAAAIALGHIGTDEAVNRLTAALAEAEDVTHLAMCDGLFACAELLSREGKPGQAAVIYDALRTLPQAPHQVRAGALRGAILVRGNEGLTLLAESIRSEDDVVVHAAVQTALDMEQPDVAPLVATEITKVSADRQVLLAGALGKLGDAETLPTLFGLAKAGDTKVRLVAIGAVGEIGGAEAVAPLMELMKDPDAAIAEAARTGFAGLAGDDADQAVVDALAGPDQAMRMKMVDMVARRRVLSAMPTLAGLMKDKNAQIRLAAIKGYGELAGAEHLPALLDATMTSAQANDHAALGHAMAAAYRNGGDPQVAVPQIAATLDKAVVDAKSTLIKILKMIGGPEAKAVVQRAVEDPNEQVKVAATRAISEWRTP